MIAVHLEQQTNAESEAQEEALEAHKRRRGGDDATGDESPAIRRLGVAAPQQQHGQHEGEKQPIGQDSEGLPHEDAGGHQQHRHSEAGEAVAAGREMGAGQPQAGYSDACHQQVHDVEVHAEDEDRQAEQAGQAGVVQQVRVTVEAVGTGLHEARRRAHIDPGIRGVVPGRGREPQTERGDADQKPELKTGGRNQLQDILRRPAPGTTAVCRVRLCGR